jgi:cob(I)alamin adenosyltransferase
MRVYTRTGDKGETSLASGTRISKDHPRLEAYGTVDELNAHLGVIQADFPDPEEKERLIRIQNRIFVVSSTLAVDDPLFLDRLPKILEEDIVDLEKAMDRMLDLLPPLKNFILPAGHVLVAQCHVARTVCRRAERLMIRVSHEVDVEPMLIKYVNRLSDYLFVLARKASFDLKVGETIWTPDFRMIEDFTKGQKT